MHFRRISSRVISVVAALGIGTTMLAPLASASPAVVSLSTVLTDCQIDPVDTNLSDGSNPLPALLDASLCNRTVATNDQVSVRMDVNINTLDAAVHQVTNTTLVSTLPLGVSWKKPIHAACSGTGSGISADGRTLTCKIPGPTNTGVTLNITNTFVVSSMIANGTVIPVSFTASATDPSAADDPAPSTSAIVNETAVSRRLPVKLGKFPQNTTYHFDPLTGVPDYVDFRWNTIYGPDADASPEATIGAKSKGVASYGTRRLSNHH